MIRFLRSSALPGTPLTRSLTVALVLGVAVLAAVLWYTNRYFTFQFTENARVDAGVRSTLYAGNILAAIDRQSVVPLILARDDALILALSSKDYTNTSQRLISILEEVEVASVMLLDSDGLTVAASDRRLIGANRANSPYVTEALRQSGTAFTAESLEEDQAGLYFSRKIEQGNQIIGILAVRADLQKLEEQWRSTGRQAFVSDSEDNVILSSNPLWKNTNIQDFITENSSLVPNQISSVFAPSDQAFTYIDGSALLQVETKIGFQGWKLSYFETLEGVRARVNGILALEIMVFAILTAMAFYGLSRVSARQSFRLLQESTELRRLNQRLQAEVAERKRAEENLQVAEQSLQQQSKLAALGQMSAAVSHELNQPLAAMRTYLAGARLLLNRKRHEEAESSFQRVEDLLDRMGALTRQLKSFARKSDDDLGPVDIRNPLNAAFSMMTPQLGTREIEITRTLPEQPCLVHADELRLEQIIVNLFRNALDAMKGVDNPHIDILLTMGEVVSLSVRDNGHGIDDVEQLFEPFYTTKKPGEGIGLGLAISAGIATDLGGSLTARNGQRGGAIFELQLPRVDSEALAAQ